MNTGELLTTVRNRLNDAVKGSSAPYWSDTELIDDYANKARNRLFLIVRRFTIDSSTASDSEIVPLPLCALPVVAGTSTYALSQKILGITRLSLASQNKQLKPIVASELDDECPGWQSLPAGVPWAYCPDLQSDSVVFIPAPIADDTANLTVYRMPLARLAKSTPSGSLGFREEYHDDLIPWIQYLAFSKQDSEVYNPQLAETHRKVFIDRAEEIKMEIYRRVTPAHGTSMRRGCSTR